MGARKGWIALAVIVVGFAWYASGHPMDFRVYYHGAAGVFDGTRPVYGEFSGLGWPMHYRYPPLFLFLAAPFTALSLPWAAAIWAVLKCVGLASLARTLWRRLGPSVTPAAWWLPILLAGPYVVEDLRFGNAQSLIFVLTGAALLAAPAAPLLASTALALAISIKVWPLFFVPYLAVRRQWKVVVGALILTAVLLLLPALYFGFGQNFRLLEEWIRQEFATQTGQSEIWFPSQSLRGVLMRYLTEIDYSQVPDSNYPLVHVAALDPNHVRWLWLALAGAGYLALLGITAMTPAKSRTDAVRRFPTEPSLWTDALAFTMLILLEPFSQKYTLVVLLWPALVVARAGTARAGTGRDGAARENARSPYRLLIYLATGLALVQPLVSGAAAQRLMQVLGFDFLATALLAAYLTAYLMVAIWKRAT